MPIQNARQQYVANSVSTASPAKLLVLLYERLARDLGDAEAALARNDMEAAHHALVHAQDIVIELRAGLDFDKWDHAGQMDRIYSFVLDRLVEANVAKDLAIVASCRTLVDPLCDAWKQAADAVLSGATTAAQPAAL